jgi:hypothetical protein
MTRRRGWIGDLAVSLVGDVLVTVLVAWTLALQVESPAGSATSDAPWPGRITPTWPARAKADWRSATKWGWGGLEQHSAWGNNRDNSAGDYLMFVTRAGWPFVALQSTLRKETPGAMSSAERDLYDNEGSYEAGITVPLHWTRPHAGGPGEWCSRRLPLQPILGGFAVNSLIASVLLLGLARLWRAQPRSILAKNKRRRSRWAHPVAIVVLGLVVSVAVAYGLWLRWQSKTPTQFPYQWPGGGSSAQNATQLPDNLAKWPAKPPADWKKPTWIGWRGEIFGVRGYDVTSHGIPAAASMWIHVMWSVGAFDSHQSMLIVQAGWPLPCIQSEELIDVEGRAPDPPFEQGKKPRYPEMPSTEPLRTRGAVWDWTLSKAPAGARQGFTPYVPARPLLLGLLVNTLFYAFPLSLVIWVPGAIRGWRRAKAGACPACGYDQRGLAVGTVCPECGKG